MNFLDSYYPKIQLKHELLHSNLSLGAEAFRFLFEGFHRAAAIAMADAKRLSTYVSENVWHIRRRYVGGIIDLIGSIANFENKKENDYRKKQSVVAKIVAHIPARLNEAADFT